MARRIMAPKVATRIDVRLKPVTPGPPRRLLTMEPPITAPTMPITMVRIIPPGSGPGMAILASIPAIRPTIIQVRIPTIVLPPTYHRPLPPQLNDTAQSACYTPLRGFYPTTTHCKHLVGEGARGFRCFLRRSVLEELGQEALQRRCNKGQREEDCHRVEQRMDLAGLATDQFDQDVGNKAEANAVGDVEGQGQCQDGKESGY